VFGPFRKKAENATPVVVVERQTSVPRTAPKGHRRAPAVGRALVRMFDAGQSDRLTGSWGAHPLTADEVVRRNQRVLVARSREQAANNDFARKFLQMCRQNIVGPRGIQLRAQPRNRSGEIDAPAAEAIERAWREWARAENCDVTMRETFRSMQASAINSVARDGEFMIRLVTGREAGPWGFALQVLDPQRCRPDHDEVRLPGGRFIRHGIEFNRFGRPLAYYFSTTRREDDADAYDYGGRSHIRIPAEEIIHGFMPDFTHQKRGLPWMATALWRLQMLGGFEKAALVNARVGATKSGFFEWQEGYGPDPEDDAAALYMEAEPGSFQELPPGVQFKSWDPQYPSNEFAPFHKAMLRGIASGLGVTYVNLANDLEGVNFSSIRQGTLDEREHWKELQEWLVESLVERVYMAWLPRALLAGRIRTAQGGALAPERLEKYRAVEWLPRRWDWIDPNADVKAAVASKDNLLTSPGQIIRDRGRDPQSVWEEIAQDIAAMRAAGIPENIIEAAMASAASGAAPRAPAGGGNPAMEDETA